ncbi:MAG: hypothetical protein JNL74_08385, partial [Fibrobacteres bacterium]|nr:hypothetical protein [Fibrobacterota bacterium]
MTKKKQYAPSPGSINDKADQLIKLIRKAGKDSSERLNALLEMGSILCECSIASPNEYLQDYMILYSEHTDNKIKIQAGLSLIEILTYRDGNFFEALHILDAIKMLASSSEIDTALQNKVRKSAIFLSIHFRWFDDARNGLKYFEKTEHQFDRSWYMMASGYVDFLQNNTFSFHKFRNAKDSFSIEFKSYKDHSDLYRALLYYQAKEIENALLLFEKLQDSYHPKTRLFAHLGVACCTNSKEDYQKYLSLYNG